LNQSFLTCPHQGFEPGEFKDLYDPPTTDVQFAQVNRLFEVAGYSIRRAELLPHGQPLAYLRMRRRSVPLLTDRRKLRHHIRQILKAAPVWFKQAEIAIQEDNGALLVSFLLEREQPVCTEADQEQEFLALP
jgi:hypothetical protein